MKNLFHDKLSGRMLLIVILSVSLDNCSFGGPVLETPETWDSGLGGWTNAPPEGTGTATLSNPDAYLRISFAAQSGAPQYEEDTIYTKAPSETGAFQAYLPELRLSFSFYAEDVLPLSSVLYMHAADSGNIWEYAFANTVVGEWTQHVVSFDYDTGWVGPGDATTFWTDLANIDWIGINIVRQLNVIQQDYGLDDWVYFVPEPGVISMLATVVVSLAFTLRKRFVGIS